MKLGLGLSPIMFALKAAFVAVLSRTVDRTTKTTDSTLYTTDRS
ncbi:hypothetical protein [Sphingomonas elodea]|nr:hypothetical protein [Sphingomonas elodea]